MDDPFLISDRERSTWPSDAEKQTESVRCGAVAAMVGIVGAGTLYWSHARHFETTDDAFVDGYVTQVAPQVFWNLAMAHRLAGGAALAPPKGAAGALERIPVMLHNQHERRS